MQGKKRLMLEAKNLKKDPPMEFVAEPLEENLFEWHFSILGPKDSDFEGGTYFFFVCLFLNPWTVGITADNPYPLPDDLPLFVRF